MSPYGYAYVQGKGLGAWSYHFERSGPKSKGSYMSNKRLRRGDLLEARMDSGKYLPDIMYFQNEKYDSVTRTFTGDISYAPDTMDGYSVARFVMVFSDDFTYI